jgi:rRNA biogenesis protein RRP5
MVADNQDLADEPVQDPHTVLKKNQVVTAMVVSVDNVLHRSKLTLKSQSSDTVEAGEQTEAINPIDNNIKFIEDYTPGRLTTAKIVAIKQTQANVALAENLQGRIDVSEVVDSVFSDDELPLKSLRKGALLSVRILGFHDAKTHRYLPITHRTSNTQTTLELSCKPSHIENNPLPTPTIEDIQIGAKHPAFVNKYAGEYIWLNITPTIRGRMHILNLTDRIERLHSLSSSYPIGSGLSVTVLGKTEDGKYLNFSCRNNPVRSINDVSVGSIIPGRVVKVADSGLTVQIGEEVIGKVGLTDISDTYSAKMTEGYRENSIVRVCILSVDLPNGRISLSMRASRTLSSSSKQTDREISSIADVKVGEILRGFVKNVANTGLFLALSQNVVGRVMIRDLSDQFLKDWKSQFKVHQLVKGKVVSVDADANKVGLSLRPSAVGDKVGGRGIDEIWEGDRVNGVVSRVEDYGLFIRLDGYSLSGLCHKSEVRSSVRIVF